MKRLSRYNDTRMSDVTVNRYFAHHVYVDPYVTIEDVMRPGFFDDCNRARQRQPAIKVMARIECECGDGLVLLRVMAVDDHHLNIETMPIHPPVYWPEASKVAAQDHQGGLNDGQQKRRGRPPKVAAA